MTVKCVQLNSTIHAIADMVWCITCQSEHIAHIPVTTFLCSDCGFGVWNENLAEEHATDFSSHAVYPIIHQVMEL